MRKPKEKCADLGKESRSAEADKEEGGDPGGELAQELAPVHAGALERLAHAHANDSAGDALAGRGWQPIPVRTSHRRISTAVSTGGAEHLPDFYIRI